MKILTFEGLKGTGKSTLLDLIVKDSGSKIIEKITKGGETWPDFIREAYNKYCPFLKDVKSSLALQFYSNLFRRLEESQREGLVLLDRGLLSLPSFCYYGYHYSKENMGFDEFLGIVNEMQNLAINNYRKFEEQTTFLIMESKIEEIKSRMIKRARESKADKFFLDNITSYITLKERFEEHAKAGLPKSVFLNLENNTQTDLEQIIRHTQRLYQT